MNSIIKILLIALVFYTGNLLAESINIYYVNGIFTTEDDAEASAKNIAKILGQSRNHMEKHKFDVFSIYNPDGLHQDFYVPPSIFQQFLDLFNISKPISEFILKKEEDISELFVSKFIEEYGSVQLYEDIKAPHHAESFPVLNTDSARRIFDNLQYEMPTFKDAVNDAISLHFKDKPTNRTIIIAHSQGNIFANYLWAYWVKNYGDSIFSKVRIINVANTSLFSPNDLNLTHENDGALFKDTAQICGEIVSLESVPETVSFERASPLCSENDEGISEKICPFFLEEPTYYGSGGEFCTRHGFKETYLSENHTFPLVDQNIVSGDYVGTTFRDRLEDMVYTAVASLDRANEIATPDIQGQFTSPFTLGDVPKFSGKAVSKHRITSILVTYREPNEEGYFTLLDCPSAVFGDCTGFDIGNTGEVDLSFMDFEQHRFDSVGTYDIRLTVENSAEQKNTNSFNVVVEEKPVLECTANETGQRSCPITNGTGQQERICSSDGQWSDYGACQITGCDDGFVNSGNICIEETTEPRYDFSLSNTSLSKTSFEAGEEIEASVSVHYSGNVLDQNMDSVDTGYFLSSDTVFDDNDIYLDHEVSGVGSDDPVHNESSILTIPNSVSEGSYYILFIADYEEEFEETNENNNVEYIGINVTITCTPNETDQRSCPITNGTGQQERVCSSDGTSWSDYGICQVTSCADGYIVSGNSCVEDPVNNFV